MSAVREGIWGILLRNYEAIIRIVTRVVTIYVITIKLVLKNEVLNC